MATSVLIVDDSPAVRETLREVLGSLAYEVAGAVATEEEVIGLLEPGEPGIDLVILDLLLEKGSGFDILARYGKRPDAVPIVVFSGFMTPVVAARCVKFGALAAFQKSDSSGLMSFLQTFRQRSRPDAGPHP